MTATVDALGALHAMLAEVYTQVLAGREEPVIANGEIVRDAEGNPVMKKVPPSAAELAAINAFLKNNNITAVQGNEGALDALRKQLEERRKGKLPLTAAAFTPPDPFATVPNPDTPWQ